MILRVILAVLALIGWALTAWFLSHQCDSHWLFGRYSKSYSMLLALMAGGSSLLTLTQVGPVFRWLHRRRGQLGLFAGATIASLVLAECAVRVLDPLGISYYVEAKRYDQEKVPDDELVYRHRPGFETVYYGKRARFNELGLRGPPIEPKGDRLRILMLGDSVVAGLAVAEQDTFVARMQALCSTPDTEVEVINTGVGSYNTVQESRFLRRHMESLDPDVVLLLYVSNDVEPAAARFNPDKYSLRNTVLGKNPPWAAYAFLRYSQLFRLIDFVLLTSHEVKKLEPAGLKMSTDALDQMAADCRARGIPFALFFWRMHGSDFENQLSAALEEAAAKDGIPYTDVLAWFEGEDPLACRVSVVDSHPNEHGHEILAQGFAAFLREQGWLRR